MTKVYLATSFSTRVDANGDVHPHFREHLEKIIESLEKIGYEVFCAIKHEGWKISTKYTPAEAIELDLQELEKADIILAVLHDDASRGVQYEMGYAVGLGKTVVAVTEPSDKLAYFNQGLIEAGTIKHIVYKNHAELATQFHELINKA